MGDGVVLFACSQLVARDLGEYVHRFGTIWVGHVWAILCFAPEEKNSALTY